MNFGILQQMKALNSLLWYREQEKYYFQKGDVVNLVTLFRIRLSSLQDQIPGHTKRHNAAISPQETGD
jgi:hypothetical protein